MAKTQLTPEFREFSGCLNRAKVDYLLLGGFAVNHYGYHRATGDIDFWIAATDENFERLLEAVRLFFGEDLAGLDMAFLKNNDTLYFGYEPNKIEVIQNADGLNFTDAYPRRLETTVDGVPVKMICLRDLRTNKQASGRYKDLADLENLPQA